MAHLDFLRGAIGKLRPTVCQNRAGEGTKADRAPISFLDLGGKMPVDNLTGNLINSDISE